MYQAIRVAVVSALLLMAFCLLGHYFGVDRGPFIIASALLSVWLAWAHVRTRSFV